MPLQLRSLHNRAKPVMAREIERASGVVSNPPAPSPCTVIGFPACTVRRDSSAGGRVGQGINRSSPVARFRATATLPPCFHGIYCLRRTYFAAIAATLNPHGTAQAVIKKSRDVLGLFLGIAWEKQS